MAAKRFNKLLKSKKGTFFVKGLRGQISRFLKVANLKNFIKRTVTFFVPLVFVLAAGNYVKGIFIASDYFNVSRIELSMQPSREEALNLKFYNISRQTNIFKVNLKQASRFAEGNHPEFKKVTVKRKLPNTLVVAIEYKEPAALIPAHPKRRFSHAGKWIDYPYKKGSVLVPVSCDGTVLPPSVADGKYLPTMTGIDFVESVVRVGDINCDKRLAYGIRFLDELNSCWTLEDNRVESVDISNIADTSIALENGLEVKIGEGNLKEKLQALKKVLDEAGFKPADVRYIDLRFKDVIVCPK